VFEERDPRHQFGMGGGCIVTRPAPAPVGLAQLHHVQRQFVPSSIATSLRRGNDKAHKLSR
jgi:hypothetical protein